ncbi:MAG: hypothetical protein KGK35_09710, partial [Xanthomonadaceae bacterium]|nr:hypothetical protein [Xanthomonadaceae bacterium]
MDGCSPEQRSRNAGGIAYTCVSTPLAALATLNANGTIQTAPTKRPAPGGPFVRQHRATSTAVTLPRMLGLLARFRFLGS